MPYHERCSPNIHVYLQPQDVTGNPVTNALVRRGKNTETRGGGRRGETEAEVAGLEPEAEEQQG